jgi:hypothetical protein
MDGKLRSTEYCVLDVFSAQRVAESSLHVLLKISRAAFQVSGCVMKITGSVNCALAYDSSANEQRFMFDSGFRIRFNLGDQAVN